jgi:thiamine transport system substrate-binding protein
LLTTVAEFGENGTYTYRDYWRDLKENETLVKNGWSDAYYGDFTMNGGTRPLIVSYTTSPAAEVFYSEGAFIDPPTGNILSPRTTFLQIEGAGILQGTTHVQLAQHFIDFAMSKTFQEDFPTRMWVFPVNPEATTDETFAAFAEIPSQPATIAPNIISENRAKWIDEWAKIMLR